MSQKRIFPVLMIVLVFLSTLGLYPSIVAVQEPRTIYGYVYIDDIINKPNQVIISFTGQDIQASIYQDGFYLADFKEKNGEIGVFLVTVKGEIYTGEETITIKEGVWSYKIDIHINTTLAPNQPPEKPTDPSPEDNIDNINLNPSLSVYVQDPDDDSMDVTFKDASDDSTIGTDTNVNSKTRASVNWNGLEYNSTYMWYAVADDNKGGTKTSNIFSFKTKKEDINYPPERPINPKPENNSENISLNTKLSVYVKDPDDDILIVSFYNASNDELIGTVDDVESKTNATTIWSGLKLNTSYSWYATANDTEFETKSDTFNFKTIKEDNNPPDIYIEKPEEGSLYLFGNNIFSEVLRIPCIIGKINIKVNASDGETGISKVELSIKGRCKLRDITEDLTIYPYTYEWNKLGFGKYNITATAYDKVGNSKTTSLTVRKFL